MLKPEATDTIISAGRYFVAIVRTLIYTSGIFYITFSTYSIFPLFINQKFQFHILRINIDEENDRILFFKLFLKFFQAFFKEYIL